MKPKDLRDEFALTVLDRVASDVMDDFNNGFKPTIEGRDGQVTVAEFTAWVCYSIADAMMAEREKTNEA